MVGRIVTAAAIAALLAYPALAVGKSDNVSWGKANISYTAYNEDAQQCGNMAFGVHAMMKPGAAKSLVALEGANFFSFFNSQAFHGEAGQREMIQAISPERAIFRNTNYEGLFDHAARVDVIEQLQQVVDTCLTARGYQKFRLTDVQKEKLHRLKPGTAEREHFLHDLGSNPHVLTTQAL